MSRCLVGIVRRGRKGKPRWRHMFMGSLVAILAGCAAQSGQQATLSTAAYDGEVQDFGVAPTNVIKMNNFEAPTPTKVVGAQTVTTPQLRDMMLGSPPPVMIDVIDGNQTVSLPGAIWLKEAGHGTSVTDPIQAKFALRLAKLTAGDKAKPIVLFCKSKTCWLSHNAAVRAVTLGYSNVSWYRGGRDAWRAAGLTMDPVAPSDF